MRSSVLLFTAAFLLGITATGLGQTGPTLKNITAFDLPGPAGKRFDYLTIDDDDQYLISAHLAAGQTYVIDLRTNRVVAVVTDTPGVEGVEYVPELKKFYTSNAHDDTIGVVDLKQMKVVKKLKTESKPDGSTYAAPFHKLYVSEERGKAVAIVDVQKDEIVGTLRFDSETGMPQYDPIARKVYVNLQDQNIFAIIDPATDKVIGRYSVGRCKGNHGMALDPEHHRAFLACDENDLMAVFDLDKQAAIAFLPLPDGPDVIKFDAGLGRIYVACYSGALSVFHQDDPNHYRKLKIFASSMLFTVLPSIQRPIAFVPLSKKRTEIPSRVWLCTKPSEVLRRTGNPLAALRDSAAVMKWITREHIKVDRVACPRLIRRFIDPQAQFLFVDESQLLETAARENATPFDAPRLPEVKLNHRGVRCSFEAIIEDYHLQAPGLERLALIVRAADIKGQEQIAVEGIGLRAMAEGFAALGLSDEELLVRQFPIYDALYEYARQAP